MNPFASISATFKSRVADGSVWFLAASLIPSIAGIVLGPINLRIIGLEDFAVLGLAGYLVALASTYSDLGLYTHLLAAFSKRSPGRFADLGNAVLLKTCILLTLLAGLWIYSAFRPREDALYAVAALTGVALLFPAMLFDWVFIARRGHFELFAMRGVIYGVQVLLTLAWMATEWDNILFIPAIMLAACAAGTAYMLRRIGIAKVREGWASIRGASIRGMAGLATRISPMSAAQLVMPYFVIYALPWYSLAEPDPERTGAFAIGYRIMMGFLALVASLVLLRMPASAGSRFAIPFARTLRISLAASALLWASGVAVLFAYYWASGTRWDFLPLSFHAFSVLMIAVFLNALRAPYVSRCLVEGRYFQYFLVHAAACLPTLVLSLSLGEGFPAGAVVWAALFPDFIATIVFVLRHHLT